MSIPFDETELCRSADGTPVAYTAMEDFAGRGVSLSATAVLATTGDTLFFRPIVAPTAGDATDPVGFELRVQHRPGGDALTPRTITIPVPHRRGGDTVIVWDAATGRREVPIPFSFAPGGTPEAEESELCTSVTPVRYTAVGFPGGSGRLIAKGESPTAGFTVFFHAIRSPNDSPLAGARHFELRQIRPTGPVAEVITPFQVEEGLIGTVPGTTITVVDAQGEHSVRVSSTDDQI